MYSPDDYKQLKNRCFACLFLFLLDVAGLIALLVVTLCLVNYENVFYFKLIGGILTSVLVFFAVFLFAKTWDCRRYLIHFDSVLSEKERHIEAKVVSISPKPLTLDDNMRVREIVLKQGEDTRTYYLLTAFFPCSFKQGSSYSFVLADRFIKGVEDEL